MAAWVLGLLLCSTAIADQASAAGSPAALPGWNADDLGGLSEALSHQCAMRSPPAPWPILCGEFRQLAAGPEPLREWIARRFIATALSGASGDTTGLITGYHEPVLTGSLRRDKPGQTPLYRRPADLVAEGSNRYRVTQGRREPYPARATIEHSGMLAGQELVWLDDPVEAFFLHIQGSGRVVLRDGSTMRVGFADHNGHRYHAIGSELVTRGVMRREDVDAPAIKAWLRANPARANDLMRTNPRFIFFRRLETPPGSGPIGSLGVPLTPERSVATDPAFVPPGALLFLLSRYPDDGSVLARTVLSQDRGAAIVGGVRADVFFGSGERAERLAGLMKEPGRIWLLWPKGLPIPGRTPTTSSSSRPASD
jgi:membrane-bound lytic murein transglycosylase A